MKLQTLSASVRFVDKPVEVERQKVVTSVSDKVIEAMTELKRAMAEE